MAGFNKSNVVERESFRPTTVLVRYLEVFARTIAKKNVARVNSEMAVLVSVCVFRTSSVITRTGIAFY